MMKVFDPRRRQNSFHEACGLRRLRWDREDIGDELPGATQAIAHISHSLVDWATSARNTIGTAF